MADIRLDDTRFQITVGEGDLSSLTRSIKLLGLLCPPTVWPNDSGFVPVSGFRRIQAVRSLLEIEKIDCRVMPVDSETACATQAVADNAFARELIPAEQVRAVKLLGRYMVPAQIARHSSGIFNRQLNPTFISELLAVSALPPRAITLLENGTLALKPARRLTAYDRETIDVLMDIFSRIKASSGKQLDIITCFTEVCRKEQIPPESIFYENGLQAILTRDTEDLGQKGDQVRQYLARRRFPNLEQARQKAKSHLGRLLSEKTFRFHLPDNFESMTYGVSFEFTSMDEFKNQAQALTSLADHPDLKGILQR
ncbi:MAG: ParB N-terminal domain-containing protein [Desulfotignum sp.]|nr:ParB N-terminal domain-containing protein [Desulfotignum sp.]